MTADDAWLLAFFRGEGEDGIHLAVSDDGLRFTELDAGPVLVAPALGDGLTRDPSLVLDDDGTVHAAWTTGWWQQGFGYARSADLVHWSDPIEVPAMAGVPSTVNVWAPELHLDPSTGELVAVYASTVRDEHPDGTSEPGPDGAGLEHRLYLVRSADGRRWSAPARLGEGLDRNLIDAMAVATEGGLVMAVKDERFEPGGKVVRLARAPRWSGPWSEPGPPVAALGEWVEGPCLVAPPEGSGGEWHLYADRYLQDGWALATSPDLVAWTDRSAELDVPGGARHGTVLRVPRPLVAALR